MIYPIQLSLFDDINNYFLPVEVLDEDLYEIISSVEALNNDFHVEITSNNLLKDIDFIKEQHCIQTPAQIIKLKTKEKTQIQISLNFCQFLWSINLFVLSYTRIFIEKQFLNMLSGNGEITRYDKYEIAFAEDTFFRARQLLYNLDRESFFNIPNICDPQIFKDIIGKANNTYLSGITFMFSHELSHSFLGHCTIENTYQDSVKQEIDADDVAFSYIKDTFDTPNGISMKVGIITLLGSLLLLGEDTISGGGSHPHMDERIDIIINKMDLADMDLIWAIAASLIRLWLLVYSEIWSIEEDYKISTFSTYKDCYLFYLCKLRKVRETKYPTIYKRDWEF